MLNNKTLLLGISVLCVLYSQYPEYFELLKEMIKNHFSATLEAQDSLMLIALAMLGYMCLNKHMALV